MGALQTRGVQDDGIDNVQDLEAVRVLVVGKTGSGKSTLIRLLLGEDGPRTIANGSRGVQDISREWRHRDRPLIIHDSDGVTPTSMEPMATIKRFLGDRQSHGSTASDSQRVHAVWYVFNAIDNRVTCDGGLLKLLDGMDLPLLLIMTNYDVAKRVDGSVTGDRALNQLLKCISDGEKRESMRRSTVRVGNRVKLCRETGEIAEKIEVDEDALRILLDRSMVAMILMPKVEWSVRFILEKVAHVPPKVNEKELGVIFEGVAWVLVAFIWSASENLLHAIMTCNYLDGEGWRALTSDQGLGIHTTAALAVSARLLMGSTSNAPVSDPALRLMIIDEPGYRSKLLVSYGLHILGTAMYARAQSSVEDGDRVCEEFSCSPWAIAISRFWEGISSSREIERLRFPITAFFMQLCHENEMSATPLRYPAWDQAEVLKGAYQSLCANNEQVKEDLRKTFRDVRILVVGKTGSGKSTLIQLILGDACGPSHIRHGCVGEQDIEREWRHPDLPFIIHDSNGIDTEGQKRMAEIKKFLGERQAYLNVHQFSQRVHAVWYVFHAMDNRVTDDRGLIKTLASYGNNLPLLLIMTHNDHAKRIGDRSEETVLTELLDHCSSDDERRERLRASIVRVGNKVAEDERGGIMNKEEVDMMALESVTKRTEELMEQERWITWAACQAVDTKAKVEASTKLILEKRYHQETRRGKNVVNMLSSVTQGLAMIWSAAYHQNISKAILSCDYLDGNRVAIGNLGRNVLTELDVAVCLRLGPTASYLETASRAFPSGTEEQGDESKFLVAYALLVVGGMMYAHTHDVAAQRSVDDYRRLYQEFLSSEGATEISGFWNHNRATVNMRNHNERERLRRRIKDLLQDYLYKLCSSS